MIRQVRHSIVVRRQTTRSIRPVPAERQGHSHCVDVVRTSISNRKKLNYLTISDRTSLFWRVDDKRKQANSINEAIQFPAHGFVVHEDTYRMLHPPSCSRIVIFLHTIYLSYITITGIT
jgi:hypothetical protein